MSQLSSDFVSRATDLAKQSPDDLVAIYSLQGLCEWASPSHESVLGYPPAEMIGRHWKQSVAPEDHAHADLAGTDALLNGRSINFGFRAAAKDGHRIEIRAVAWIGVDAASGSPHLFFHGKLANP